MNFSQFNTYFNWLPLAELRSRVWFGHPGAFYPETMYFWGNNLDGDYGCNVGNSYYPKGSTTPVPPTRKNHPINFVSNPFQRYHIVGTLELASQMLEYYDFTRNSSFMPLMVNYINQALEFYNNHYYTDQNNHMVMIPSQSLETWQESITPTPDLAGLKYIISRLFYLIPQNEISPENITFWKNLNSTLPPIPNLSNGNIAPAYLYMDEFNSEDPELYTIFPFRLYGLNNQGTAPSAAINSYNARQFQGNQGWRQDVIWAALLGLTNQAASMVRERFLTPPGSNQKFPSFWGPFYDWIPEEDQGSVARIAIQTMLIQYNGDNILLFPAWPKYWDVDFQLHAPQNTIITGSVSNGVAKYTVSPPSRAGDVIVLGPH